MIEWDQIRQALVAGGAASADQLDEAGRQAEADGIGLEEAVIRTGTVGLDALGRCLGQITHLPYEPLLRSAPADEARRLISVPLARARQVFPVRYSRERNVLVVAVSDPAQPSRLRQLFHFLMQPFALEFTIASRTEIDRAIETHLAQGKAGARPAGPAAPGFPDRGAARERPVPAVRLRGVGRGGEDAAPAGSAAAARIDRSAFVRAPGARDNAPAPARPPRQASRASPTPPYADMSRALCSAAAFLVHERVGTDAERLDEITARVRYCQLLASRLDLDPVQRDAVTLAAWFSAFDDCRDVLKRVAMPYALAEVLAGDEDPGNERVERAVLELVTRYQEVHKRDPDAVRDLNLTRRNLRMAWSSAPDRQGMLETFLQILVDEEFLTKLDQTAGRIMIADPSEVTTSILTPPLRNLGYDVAVMPDAAAANAAIPDWAPDLIIADLGLPQEGGVKFCQRLKRDAATSHIPCLVLIPEGGDKHAAECLRAGADDAVLRPVDLQLLFVKIQRLIARPGHGEAEGGVKGSIADMGFTDLIQIVCAGGKSMEIVLTCGDEEGHVFIQDGQIIHAAAGEREGEEAFYRLMQWTDGEFITRQCTDFPPATIQGSAMGLLMEGARLADQAKGQ